MQVVVCVMFCDSSHHKAWSNLETCKTMQKSEQLRAWDIAGTTWRLLTGMVFAAFGAPWLKKIEWMWMNYNESMLNNADISRIAQSKACHIMICSRLFAYVCTVFAYVCFCLFMGTNWVGRCEMKRNSNNGSNHHCYREPCLICKCFSALLMIKGYQGILGKFREHIGLFEIMGNIGKLKTCELHVIGFSFWWEVTLYLVTTCHNPLRHATQTVCCFRGSRVWTWTTRISGIYPRKSESVSGQSAV